MKRRSIAAILTVVFVLAQTLPVLAAGMTYSAETGQKIYIENYLVMRSEANVPNQTFTFSIDPGAAQDAVDGKLQVFAGNDGNRVSGTPSIGTSVFREGQDTYDSAQTFPKATDLIQAADGKTDPVTLTSGQKYARSSFSVDFSEVSFREPGVYRYLITESGDTDGHLGISNDPDR